MQILFGGSGSELVLCKNLKRNFISSELHKPYYDMIIARMNNGGIIADEYKLECALKNNFKKKDDLLNDIKTEKDFDLYIKEELKKALYKINCFLYFLAYILII